MLYLVATPIGNLEDISYRAVRMLQEVDYIAAEDTRHSRKLLQHYQIQTPMISYHQHNERQRSQELVDMMLEGKTIALISDAGTPGISDPGEVLVRLCHDTGITVSVIPGANAAISGLVVSGLATAPFVFLGFLSTDKKELKLQLEQLKAISGTAVLYEAPHRVQKTLKVLLEQLGDVPIAMVRELTKVHETVWRGIISRAIIYLEEQRPRGEYVLLLELKNLTIANVFWKDWTLEQHMEHYEKQGVPRREALKHMAKDREVPKRELYDYFMK